MTALQAMLFVRRTILLILRHDTDPLRHVRGSLRDVMCSLRHVTGTLRHVTYLLRQVTVSLRHVTDSLRRRYRSKINDLSGTDKLYGRVDGCLGVSLVLAPVAGRGRGGREWREVSRLSLRLRG